MDNPFKGIDRGMNVAVLHIASKLFPQGWDVVPEAEAPSTLEAINAAMAGGRMKVSGDNCAGTSFGCPEVNIAFRAWHDWTHWKHQLPFNVEGETATAWMQIEHLRHFGLWTPFKRDFLLAEVVDQVEHYARTGTFPVDQWGTTYEGLTKRGHTVTDAGSKLFDILVAHHILTGAAVRGDEYARRHGRL